MAYDLHELELTGLEIKTLLQVRITHEPGKHGTLWLEADLGEERKNCIPETQDGQVISLYGRKEGRKEPIFQGIITQLEGQSAGNSYHLTLTAHTFSYLLDIRKRSRSFQDITMTLGSLLTEIVGEYGGECQILFPDRALGEIAVQYEETDWAFMKRMLSARNIPLASSEVREKPCLYAGIAEIPTPTKIQSLEGVEKLTDEKAYWTEKGVPVQDEEFIAYRLRLGSRVMLYSQIHYRERLLSVCRLEYDTVGGRLFPLVTLRKKEGIREKGIFPAHLTGSALEGKILQIKGEKVQIHLDIDADREGKDCYWFPFSTPSASADGSGWYYMPEKGDTVRVYFPTMHTREVVAISAVGTYEGTANPRQVSGTLEASGGNTGGGAPGGNTGGGAPGGASGMAGAASGGAVAGASVAAEAEKKKETKDKMGDPSTKYLSTVDGHALKLTKKGIEVICSGGAVTMELLKSGKINFYARDAIKLITEADIILKTKMTFRASCKDAGYLVSQMGGKMILNEEGYLVFQGAEVHMN